MMNTQATTAGNWQEALYVGLAVAGLAGTWAQVFGYFEAGFLGGNIAFWKDTLVNPASRFIVVDIFVLGAALFIWMFSEGRRLGISGAWLWAYFLGSVLIAISFAFPLFLAHRQRLLRTRHPQQHAAPAASDLFAVGFTVILALAAAIASLLHIPG